jgi:hypothetical protein
VTKELDFSYADPFRQSVRGSGTIPLSCGSGEVDVQLTVNPVGIGNSHRF